MKPLIIAAALLVSNLCWAGPIIVGRGAGESEYALLFAQAQITDLLSVCSMNRCSLNPAESAALGLVQAAAAKPLTAEFKSESDMPGQIFRVIGTQVWFNQDELWLDPSQTIAYDVPHAAGLWIQVLGQNADPQVVSSLRLKVQSALNLNLGTNSTPYGEGSLAVVFWSHSVFLRDVRANVLPLTAPLMAQIASLDANSLQFFSARWTNVNPATGAVRLDLNLMWTVQGNPARGVATVMMQVNSDGVIDPKTVKALVQEE